MLGKDLRAPERHVDTRAGEVRESKSRMVSKQELIEFATR